MIKLKSMRSMRFSRSKSNISNASVNGGGDAGKGCGGNTGGGEIKWELRPGGMLVQKREDEGNDVEVITVRVSTAGSTWHDISIEATSTFGELKMILSLVTNLEAREQRLLYKGKEREDGDYLHMVGVKDMEKVLLLEDPAIKEKKLRASLQLQRKLQQQQQQQQQQQTINPCRTISV